MTNIKFSGRAYCKMILHAMKYPHCTVNGVLLAKTSTLGEKEVEFVDSMPLFHICVNLTPMAEIALMQIDELASKKGLTIAGYYIVPDNISRDNVFEKAYHRIADKIASNCNKSYLIIANSTNTTIHKGNVALKIAQFVDGSYKPCENSTISFGSSDTINACIRLVENFVFKDLVDFDNHLDNISLDWTNSIVNKEIEYFL